MPEYICTHIHSLTLLRAKKILSGIKYLSKIRKKNRHLFFFIYSQYPSDTLFADSTDLKFLESN